MEGLVLDVAMQRQEVAQHVVDEAEQALSKNRPIDFWEKHGKESVNFHWPDGKPKVIAARVLHRLGDRRGHDRLQLINFRALPDDPHTRLYHLYNKMGRRGVFHAYELVQGYLNDAATELPDQVRADMLDVRAFCHAWFRDDSNALSDLDEASRLSPDRPWVAVGRCNSLVLLDRREEAMERVEELLKEHPQYRPAVLCHTDLLIKFGRLDQAIESLTEAHEQSQLADYAARLSSIASDRDDVEEAGRWLDSWRERVPLADRDLVQWEAQRRADLAIVQGRLPEAREWISKAKSPFHDSLTKHLEHPEAQERKRVRLDVEFVSQHDMTCAPATLASLCSYWKRPYEHLEIAEEICYDGTPSHSQRRWANENGFHARHFRVDMDSTKALIDAGVPFALTTMGTGWSHLQAVIGYDDRAGLLIVRDPTSSHYTEISASRFFESDAAYGPLGLVFLPEEELGRLEGIELPEADLLDGLNAIHEALEDHRREEARQIGKKLREEHPDHRVTLMALWFLASYDGNATMCRQTLEKLHQRYPKNEPLALQYFYRLKETASHNELVEWLRERTAKHDCDAAFLRELASLQSSNAAEWDAAGRTLSRLMSISARDAVAMNTMASLCWEMGERDRAVMIYRMAAFCEDRNEWHARSYANALRWVGRRDEAIAHLRRRFDDYGSKRSGPAMTLAEFLDDGDQREEADKVLEEAQERLAESGELTLLAAGRLLDRGELTEAKQLLDSVRDRCKPSEWLRSSARLARLESRQEDELEMWKQLLEDEPLAMDAHSACAFLTGALGSTEDALNYLAETRKKFPTHVGLAELHVMWLRDELSDDIIPVLKDLLEIQPLNDWALRELAFAHANRQQYDEAKAAAARGVEVAPNQSYSHSAMGHICLDAGERSEAIGHFREAIKRSADNPSAIDGIIDAADDTASRRKIIDEVVAEMKRQVVGGDSIVALQRSTYPFLEPPELLELLREIHEERPDLPQSWSVLIDQMSAMQLLDEALEKALDFTSRFPVLGDSWMTLAKVHHDRLDPAKEVEALEQASRLHPQWRVPLRRLVSAYEEVGRLEDAVAVGRKAVRANPLEYSNHGVLADLLWRQGEKEEAIAEVELGLALNPDYGWAWEKIDEWGRVLERKDLAIDTARSICSKRSHDPQSWHQLAEVLASHEKFTEALEAVEKGLERNPHELSLIDLRIRLVLRVHGLDAAFEACEVEIPGRKKPVTMRGRKAWLIAITGNLNSAITEMSKIIEDEPSYHWGARQLVEWQRQAGKNNDAIKTARHLVRLDPDNPEAHGYLAALLSEAGNEDEAAKAIERAFGIDPTYYYAASNLLGHQLDKNDLKGAEHTVKRYARYAPGPMATAFEVRLAKARGDQEFFREKLSELMNQSGEADEAVDWLHGMCGKERPWSVIWKNELKRAVTKNKSPNQAAATIWARGLPIPASMFLGNPLRRVLKLKLPDEARDQALSVLLDRFQKQYEPSQIESIVKSNSKLLKSSTVLWHSAARVLQLSGKNRKVCQWMAGWETREGLEPWMLIPLAHALDAEQGPVAALPVRARMMEMESFSDRYLHEVGLAFGLAMQGDDQQSESWIQHIDEEGLPEYYGVLRWMTLALLMSRRPDGDIAEIEHVVSKAAETWPVWRSDKALNKAWSLFMPALRQSPLVDANWKAVKKARNSKTSGFAVLNQDLSTAKVAIIIVIAVVLFRLFLLLIGD